jgi:hypothetical protein
MLEQTIEQVNNDDEFHKINGESEPEIPEIMLYKGRIQGKLGDQDIHSDVIEVYVARENAQLTKYLFEASSNLSARNLEIVPRDFKFNHPTIYGQILNKQNAYLSKHRNIAIVAIPVHAMYHAITDQKAKRGKHSKLRSLPSTALHTSMHVSALTILENGIFLPTKPLRRQ